MTLHSDADYYARREQQERARAQAAVSSRIRDIHATLAQNYARRAIELAQAER